MAHAASKPGRGSCSTTTTVRRRPWPRISPVAAAQVSAAARTKPQRRRTADGQPVHSWRTLLADLATLTGNTARFAAAPPATILSTPTPTQQRAFDLLGLRLQP
jgi:hypothetical protein